MNPRFNNKICIVTGAAQGIGQGVALALAVEGGTAVLADRSEFVHHTAEAIRSAGGKCLTVMAGRSFDPKALRRGQVADDAGDGEDASSSNHHPDKFWDDSHILAGNTRREAGKRSSA